MQTSRRTRSPERQSASPVLQVWSQPERLPQACSVPACLPEQMPPVCSSRQTACSCPLKQTALRSWCSCCSSPAWFRWFYPRFCCRTRSYHQSQSRSLRPRSWPRRISPRSSLRPSYPRFCRSGRSGSRPWYRPVRCCRRTQQDQSRALVPAAWLSAFS